MAAPRTTYAPTAPCRRRERRWSRRRRSAAGSAARRRSSPGAASCSCRPASDRSSAARRWPRRRRRAARRGDDDDVVDDQRRAGEAPARDRRAGIGRRVARPDDRAVAGVERVEDAGRAERVDAAVAERRRRARTGAAVRLVEPHRVAVPPHRLAGRHGSRRRPRPRRAAPACRGGRRRPRTTTSPARSAAPQLLRAAMPTSRSRSARRGRRRRAGPRKPGHSTRVLLDARQHRSDRYTARGLVAGRSSPLLEAGNCGGASRRRLHRPLVSGSRRHGLGRLPGTPPQAAATAVVPLRQQTLLRSRRPPPVSSRSLAVTPSVRTSAHAPHATMNGHDQRGAARSRRTRATATAHTTSASAQARDRSRRNIMPIIPPRIEG